MRFIFPRSIIVIKNTCLILCCALFFCACNTTRKTPYLVKNSFTVIGGKFTRLERSALEDRFQDQLEDSSRVEYRSILFVSVPKKPPFYDTAFSVQSVKNIEASMVHLGYYQSEASYKADTSRGGKKVSVHYTVNVGKPLLIDTFTYRLSKPELQELALRYKDDAVLKKNNPVTKAGVLGEIGRLVDTFRNNGYYKITAAELRMRGDTSIAALTNVSDDPFAQLELLAEAERQRDSPTVKLAVNLLKPEDTTKLNKYYINDIYVLQDYIPGDNLTDTVNITQRRTRSFVLRYHKSLFRTAFLARNISLRPGRVYSLADYNKTLYNLSKASVWQTASITVHELKDTPKVDLVIEMVPVKKFNFEAALEASYSATSNTNAVLGGNLIGFSGNLSLTNRNIAREAIRMTHNLRAGIELNNNSRAANVGTINSTELSYLNTVTIPRNIPFIPAFLKNETAKGRSRARPGESFISAGISYNRRFALFDLQTFNIGLGKTWPDKKNNALRTTTYIFKPLTAQFSYLNKSDSFEIILQNNRFLEYSYNTAFTIGMGAGVSFVYRNPKHLKSISRERSISLNGEESGLSWGLIPVLKADKKRFIKLDAEYKYTVNFRRTALAFRAFTGVGLPLFKDTALPFFKQFYGGGSYSMRGWPVRGIGRGGQALTPYSENVFNDRTGDIQIELNGEYRYNIARIIPNLLTLRGAVFVDIGNVWNMKNTTPAGQTDSAVFRFGTLYQQLGLSAGTGFRLDFNYVILRFDFGFRFKRPELSYYGNDGWKAPPIGFDDFFKKIFTAGKNNEYRKWRYENFNFTIGIGYPL